MRKVLMYSIVANAAALLLFEGVASILIAAREAKQVWGINEEAHCQYDEDLGWTNRPNVHIPDLYGQGKSYSTNSQGLRAQRDYEVDPPEGRYRIRVVGDSFTMGFGVDNSETYPAQMEAQSPGIQTINMGMGGYGLDQCYLWFKRDGGQQRSDLVIFAFNAYDFFRMKSDRFVGYSKPRLRAEDQTLLVENVPVPHDWGSRTTSRRLTTFAQNLAVGRIIRWMMSQDKVVDTFYGEVENEVFAAATLALDDAKRICHERGEQFVLVYLPVDALLANEPTPEFDWMENYARSHGIPLVNLTPVMSAIPSWELPDYFLSDHHYSVRGNRLVAESLMQELQKRLGLAARGGTQDLPGTARVLPDKAR